MAADRLQVHKNTSLINKHAKTFSGMYREYRPLIMSDYTKLPHFLLNFMHVISALQVV